MSRSAFSSPTISSSIPYGLREYQYQAIDSNDPHFLHLYECGNDFKVLSGGKSGGLYCRSYKDFFNPSNKITPDRLLQDRQSWITAFAHNIFENEFFIGNRDGLVKIYTPQAKKTKLALDEQREIDLSPQVLDNATDQSSTSSSSTPSSSGSPSSEYYRSRIQAISSLKLQSGQVLSAIAQYDQLIFSQKDSSLTSAFSVPPLLDIKGIDDGLLGSLQGGGVVLYAIQADEDGTNLDIKEFYSIRRTKYCSAAHATWDDTWATRPNWKELSPQQQSKTLRIVPLGDGLRIGACQSDGSFTVFDLATGQYTDIPNVVPWVLNDYNTQCYASRRVWSAVLPDPTNNPNLILTGGDAPRISLLDLRVNALCEQFALNKSEGRISAMVVPSSNSIIATIAPKVVKNKRTDAVGLDLRYPNNVVSSSCSTSASAEDTD